MSPLPHTHIHTRRKVNVLLLDFRKIKTFCQTYVCIIFVFVVTVDFVFIESICHTNPPCPSTQGHTFFLSSVLTLLYVLILGWKFSPTFGKRIFSGDSRFGSIIRDKTLDPRGTLSYNFLSAVWTLLYVIFEMKSFVRPSLCPWGISIIFTFCESSVYTSPTSLSIEI